MPKLDGILETAIHTEDMVPMALPMFLTRYGPSCDLAPDQP